MTYLKPDPYKNLVHKLHIEFRKSAKTLEPYFYKIFDDDERNVLGLDDPDKNEYFFNVIMPEMIEDIADETGRSVRELQKYFNDRIERE